MKWKLIDRTLVIIAIAVTVAATLGGCARTHRTSPADDPAPGQGESTSTTGETAVVYKQIERLARPVINEGLVIAHSNLNVFNAVAPSADLTPAAGPILQDVATTLTAVYAGVCFVYGHVLGLTPAQASAAGLNPGGLPCQATGTSIFSDGTATSLSAAFTTSAGNYVGAVAGYFLPDVTRIDLTGPSGYNAQTCNALASGAPALCGGRRLDDDVMNVTYGFLFAGNANPATLSPALKHGSVYAQAAADANGAGNVQGHKALLGVFPYAPAPY